MNRFICLAITFAMIVGCTGKKEDGPTKPGETPVKPGGTPTPTTAESPKEFTVTAGALKSEYDRDPIGSNEKYAGKTVVVTGPFDMFYPNGPYDDAVCCLCLRQPVSDSQEKICCHFAGQLLDRDAKLRSLTRGQSVTVRGTMQYQRLFLKDCTILKMDSVSKAIPVTLKEIEGEVYKNGAEDYGRFKERDVLVRVTIQKPVSFANNRMTIGLFQPDGCKMNFDISGSSIGEETDNELKALKTGDKVLFLAHVGYRAGLGTVYLQGARILKSVPEGLKLPD